MFTNSFPFGVGEEFLDVEINYLSNSFDKVIVIPYHPKGKLNRTLPKNVTTKEIDFKGISTSKKLGILLYRFPLIFIWLFKGFYSSAHKKEYLKNPIWILKIALHRITCFHLTNSLIKGLPHKTILYSYWFNTWGSVLSLLNYTKNKQAHLIRIHGYDYDEDQNEKGFFPFRSWEMKHIYHLAPISNYGKTYIEKKYPRFKGINSISKLGTRHHDESEKEKDDLFTIASCSSVEKIKRVHLIIEILQHIKLHIRWVHIGDGVLLEGLKTKAKKLPQNITVEFKGYMQNSDVIEYYKKNNINLFINVSSNEGIPVSIMEAISFGTTIIGCNVGGVSEIVTEKTGHLIPKDFKAKEVAQIIEDHAILAPEERKTIAESAKNFWKENYSADKNYTNFIEKLKTL